ncbi:MAG TPA: hypothetical protein VMD59_08285 [Acidimicrobiales bacterium]|nr:hypothetical protein [Acidimicrobiales bacterium]
MVERAIEERLPRWIATEDCFDLGAASLSLLDDFTRRMAGLEPVEDLLEQRQVLAPIGSELREETALGHRHGDVPHRVDEQVDWVAPTVQKVS